MGTFKVLIGVLVLMLVCAQGAFASSWFSKIYDEVFAKAEIIKFDFVMPKECQKPFRLDDDRILILGFDKSYFFDHKTRKFTEIEPFPRGFDLTEFTNFTTLKDGRLFFFLPIDNPVQIMRYLTRMEDVRKKMYSMVPTLDSNDTDWRMQEKKFDELSYLEKERLLLSVIKDDKESYQEYMERKEAFERSLHGVIFDPKTGKFSLTKGRSHHDLGRGKGDIYLTKEGKIFIDRVDKIDNKRWAYPGNEIFDPETEEFSDISEIPETYPRVRQEINDAGKHKEGRRDDIEYYMPRFGKNIMQKLPNGKYKKIGKMISDNEVMYYEELPDGRILFYAGENSQMELFDPKTGKSKLIFPRKKIEPQRAIIFKDGTIIFSHIIWHTDRRDDVRLILFKLKDGE